MPAAVLAHAAHGDTFEVPEWLLESGLVVVALLTWLALRTSWPRPRLAAVGAGRLLPPWTAGLLRGLAGIVAAAGLVLWLVVLAAGLFAVDDPTENLAPMVVNHRAVAGGVLVSLVLSTWWQAASPFATLARILPDGVAARKPPPWVGPGLLATLLWLTTAFHLGGEVRWIGAWLLGYSVAVLAGAAAWGRSWVTDGEGIALLLGSVGRIAPLTTDADTGRLRLRPPLAGLGAADLPRGAVEVCLLTGATAVYSAVKNLDWFQREIMGFRSGWERTMVDTVGLAFMVGITFVVWRALAGTRSDDAAPVVPLATGVTIAFLLSLLAERTVDAIALLSDPFGRGWDLFGTSDWFPNPGWQSSSSIAWAEVVAIAIGTVLAVVVAHDRGLAAGPDRATADAGTRRVVAAITVLATAALVALLR